MREAAERARRVVENPSDLPFPVQLALGLDRPSLTLTQRAIRENPDDARLWDVLGEVYAHRGAELLAEPGSEGKAMARAIALDSGLTRSYRHVLTASYRLDPDSARISELIDREEANGTAAEVVKEDRVIHAIAFGDSAARTIAYRALDGFSLTPGASARWNLSHPLFLPQRAEVFRIASQRTGESLEPAFSDWLVVRTALDRGRIAEALQELGNRGLLESLRLPAMYRAYAQGLPIPASVLDSVLRIVVADTVMDPQPGYEFLSDGGTRTPLFYTAAYATSEGVSSSAADAARRFRAAALHHREADDMTKVRIALGTAKALQALDAWKIRGDLIEARRLLEEAQAGELFDQWQENRIVRWWLGELLVESGELREAVPYYVSLVEGEPSGLFDPPAMYRLGELYEQLGDAAKARHAYQYFLLAWRDADPELQPWVETAREGLDRLGPLDQ